MKKARWAWSACALLALAGCAGLSLPNGDAEPPEVPQPVTASDPDASDDDLPLYPSPSTDAEAEELPPPPGESE